MGKKETINRRRILAVFAHPDDEAFLAGGTLAKYAAQGEVFLLCATSGEGGRRGDYEHLSNQEFAGLRRKELEAGCRVLGIHRPMFLECSDRGLARQCWDSATREIMDVIRRLRPDVVITFGPDGISGHPDHVALSQIVTRAFWGMGAQPAGAASDGEAQPFRPACLYYVLRSASVPSCCAPNQALSPPPVTTVIDIQEFGRRKLAAIRSHRSQKHLQPEDDPKTIDAILKGRENFHRAFPPRAGGGIANDLFTCS